MCFFAEGVVSFTSDSTSVEEMNTESVCVTLDAGTGTSTSLGIALTVTVATYLNGKAGT